MNTKEIGNLIRRRRRELGIDQQRAARHTGLSVHTWSDVESGKGNPTLETLVLMLDALGLSLEVRPNIPLPPEEDS